MRRRYGYKLGAGLLGAPLNFGIQLMATRALGPAGYGSFSFLSGFFNDVISFFDSGTSTGFYAKLCARPAEQTLIVFYWRFLAAVSLALVGLTAVVITSGGLDRFWPGQAPLWIALALLNALSTWGLNVAGKILDAYGLTVQAERARLISRVFGFVLVAGLFAAGGLLLPTYFIALCSVAVVQLFVWEHKARRAGRHMFPSGGVSGTQTRAYGREFWSYSSPLLTYAFIGMVAGVADRWMLQRFAGAAEQGFYGISSQVGAVCFLLTSAMVPLISREFAQAHAAGDLGRMRSAFENYIPKFYEITCIISVFLSFHARDVAILAGGPQFAGAGAAMALMCLAPIHQTYGQLSGAVLYATGETRLYRNIGVSVLLLGLLMNVALLASPSEGGLGLGAEGLAIKWITIQFIGVNLQLWFNARLLGLSFPRLLARQLFPVAVLFFVAFFTAWPLPSAWPSLAALVVAAGLYVGTIVILTCIWPSMTRLPVRIWIRTLATLARRKRWRNI